MKKLLVISTIIVGTFASVGTASALDFSNAYSGWAIAALNSDEMDN